MNPNKIYQSYMESGTAMAEAKYAFKQLDTQTKSILAHDTMLAREVDGVKSMAEAKEIALASSQYRDHLRDVCVAELEYEKARVAYSAVQALFDAQRTVEATERASLRGAA